MVHQDSSSMARRGAEPPRQSMPPEHVPQDFIRTTFAKNLQAKLNEKGWNQSRLAKELAPHLKRHSLGRDSISKYCRGKNLPGPLILEAMAKVLGCATTDLLPSRGAAKQDNPPFNISTIGDGLVWVRLNQAMTEEEALEISRIVWKRKR